MKKEQKQYHIDVTPEEDALFRDEIQIEEFKNIKKQKVSFRKVLFGVIAAHCLIAGGIAITSAEALQTKPNLKEPVQELPKPYQKITEQQAVSPEPVLVDNIPSNTKLAPLPLPKPVLRDSLTEEYTVKKGDTIYSIARKYKLHVGRLIQINQIKNPNQIQVGQKIKFL